MSKLKSLVPAVLACVFLAGTANAQAPVAWYNAVTIKYVYAGYAGGRIAVAVTTPINIGGCGGLQEFTIDPANPYFKQMMMLIMTAYVMGKPISLYTDGACFSLGVRLLDVNLPT